MIYIKMIPALSIAIVLGGTAAASAAPKGHKDVGHQSGLYARAPVIRTPSSFDPDSPQATGGGSIGYNQMTERGW